MQEITNLDRIDAYLDKTMTEEEAAAFEREVIDNPSLRAELNLVRKLQEGIQYQGEKELRDKIRSTHKELQENQFFNSSTKTVTMAFNQGIKWIYAAAAVLVLGLGYVYFFKQEKSLSHDEFMAKYMQNDFSTFDAYAEKLEAQGFAGANPLDSLGRDEILISATKYLKTGKYAEADQSLTNWLQAHPDDLYARYYLGRAKLELTKFSDAAQILTPFETETDSLYMNFEFRNEALFDLTKCFLAAQNLEGYEKALEITNKMYQDPNNKNYKLNQEIKHYYEDRIRELKEGKE